jgi:hypothetical protein
METDKTQKRQDFRLGGLESLPEGEAQWQTLFPEGPVAGFSTSLN